MVVGTAGHIDHGKTSLVRALTGTDTDRLKEEKQRGISIDLGFAEMRLPGSETISFVDVPGHERFVRNMLAGAAGMEAVVLIVAANESVMPQTREHFEICRLLGLRRGLVALTKCDLASAEEIAIAKDEIRALVTGSFLADAPVIEVSALTGAGLAELRDRLAAMVTQESVRDGASVVRMPVDRSFAVKGFGTVVTGTLLSGTVNTGDTLEVHPGNAKVRVRGLQVQHAAVEQACAGQRVAMNLIGVEHTAVKRGCLIVGADALAGTRVVDVELNWLDGDALPTARELFVMHLGTAEVNARIALYGRFARVRLASEVIAIPGDRFVIRRPSPTQTVGGGVVLDAFPQRMRRLKTIARLERLSSVAGGDLARLIAMLTGEAALGRSIAELVRMTGASRSQLEAAIGSNPALMLSGDQRVVTREWIDGKRDEVVAWLKESHAANPNAAGAPLAAARLSLPAGLAALVFKDFGAVRIDAEVVALASHKARFTQQELSALQKIENEFRAAGFQPPSLTEVMANAGVEKVKARSLVESLVKSNKLVRLPDDLLFHSDVIAHIRTSLAKQKGRRFSVAEFKTWTNISRKFAIPLLEYLDQQRVTRRDGETRVVL